MIKYLTSSVREIFTILACFLVLTAMAVSIVYMVGEFREQMDCSFATVEIK